MFQFLLVKIWYRKGAYSILDAILKHQGVLDNYFVFCKMLGKITYLEGFYSQTTENNHCA